MESQSATSERRASRSAPSRDSERAPRRDSERAPRRDSERAPRRATERGSKRGSRIGNAEDAARRAATSLSRLIGHPAEGSSEVGRGEDRHWRVCVDVVEVRRIPDTMSLMATYEVDLAEDGDLLGYRRVRRYHRGAADG
jgi:hypothetical protein